MKTENENAQASTLRQEISTVITKFEKHTYEQMKKWHLIQNQRLLTGDIQGTSLDLL